MSFDWKEKEKEKERGNEEGVDRIAVSEIWGTPIRGSRTTYITMNMKGTSMLRKAMENPSVCPHCGSDDKSQPTKIEIKQRHVAIDNACNACPFEWRAYYTLTDATMIA